MVHDPERAKSLFLAAADLSSSDERAAYLHRECGSDTDLRARVEALLAADDGASRMAETQGSAFTADPNQTVARMVSTPASPTILLPAQSYVVGKEIAHGGMGSVLHAQDTKLGRDVAMKVMRLSAAASEEARSRFIREATVLARLEHPNIVPIHELGWDAENRLYYTMKLVQGRTLQAILNGLRQRDPDFISYYTLDRLLTIFRKVCDAMSLAHAKGVIHRDLKPDNIMVGEFGEVLVMDWGLAKIQADAKQAAEEAAMKADASSAERFRELADSELSRSAGLTLDGAVMGTPLYMSPEQASGKLSEIDQQSDIFSLGGILYALLTLHPPVDGKTADEIMSRIKGGQILPPTAYNHSTKSGTKRRVDKLRGGTTPLEEMADPKTFQPLPHCPHGKVPTALSAVTMRALAVEKTSRYRTVAELAADIEAYQGGFATRAEEAGLFTQLRLLVQRHKREFGVAFAAWFIITALAVWFVINLRAKERETQHQAEIARQNEQKAVAEASRATVAEHAARESEAEALREKESARRAFASAAVALAEAALREGRGAEMQTALNSVPQDLRDSTWSYLLERSDTSVAQIRCSGPKATIADIAAVPQRPGVFAIAETNNRITLVDAHTASRLFEFSAATNDATVAYHIAVSADGQQIAVARRATKDGVLAIFSAADGKKLMEWPAPRTHMLQFSPDGKLLLQSEWSRLHLNVWDVSTGKLKWNYESANAHAMGAFTPDGSQILTFGYSDQFRLVNTADGTLIRGFKHGNGGYVSSYAVGLRWLVASMSDTGFLTVYDLRDGRIICEFRVSDRNRNISIAFLPTGEQIVSVVPLRDGSQSITIWNARTGERLRSLLGGQGTAPKVAVHPMTGELIVGGSTARVWKLSELAPTWDIKTNGHAIPVAFWGSDDVLFSNRTGIGCILQKLEGVKVQVLWHLTDFKPDHAVVCADATLAIAWNDSWNDHTTTGPRMVMLRNPGPNPEQVGEVKVSHLPEVVRLTRHGDLAAAISVSYSHIDIFETSTNKQPVKLERSNLKRIWDVGWLDEEKHLVGLATAREERGNPGSEELIVLWDVNTGKLVKSVRFPSALGALAVSPDGKRFAVGGVDMIVRIRDAETLDVMREFRAHDGPITALAWHPSRAVLASASEDLSVKLWNADTGRRMEEFHGPENFPRGLTFSPTGRRLACSSEYDATRIWEPTCLTPQPPATQPADKRQDFEVQSRQFNIQLKE